MTATVTQIRPREAPATPVPATWDAYFRAYAGLSLADLDAILEETAR